MKHVLLSFLFFISCTQNPPPIHEVGGEIFGSYYKIKYVKNDSPIDLKKELSIFFESFNKDLSTYQSNSLISHFNQSNHTEYIPVSPRFIRALKISKDLYDKTQGAFDPTLKPVIELWGFGGAKPRTTEPSQNEITLALSKIGFHNISWNEKKLLVKKNNPLIKLDVNAFAPGMAADEIASILESHQIKNYLIDVSGEFVSKGKKDKNRPWVIGIETPSPSPMKPIMAVIKLKNEALATSGNYRQFFESNGKRKSHIIDPRSGRPVEHAIASATTITTSAALADGWSTAMMVLGESGLALAQKYGVKVYLLKAQNKNQFIPINTADFEPYILNSTKIKL